MKDTLINIICSKIRVLPKRKGSFNWKNKLSCWSPNWKKSKNQIEETNKTLKGPNKKHLIYK